MAPQIRWLLSQGTLQMSLFSEQVRTPPHCPPEAGQRALEAWIGRYKLTGLVEIQLEGTQLKLERKEEALTQALDLAGGYGVTTDVVRADLSAQQVHDSYLSLRKVERDFRTLKTGLLEVWRVGVRKESRTRGRVFCCMLALSEVIQFCLPKRRRLIFAPCEMRVELFHLNCGGGIIHFP